MRRIAFLLLAAVSLLSVAAGETRPRYGGTLRVMLQAPLNSLELSTNGTPSDYWDSVRVQAMLADNLVSIDVAGRPQPELALAWQSDANGRRWSFTVRQGVKFDDGNVASAAVIAQILGERHPEWTVRGAGDSLTVESDSPLASLLAELALPRNAIVKRNSSGLPIGTGALRVADFQPGKFVKLIANEDSWAGRPFVDVVEIELGRSLRDQDIALDLSKADLIEAIPQSPALNSGSQRVRTSLSVELMALAFPANSKAQDARLREALALVIDRKPIQSVLLKGAAEPTASILPNWMTGYSAVFSTQANVQRAKAVLADSRQPTLTLSYDPRDPQAQLIAERIALNAREAGITLQVSLSGVADVNLTRIVLPSADPATSLREAARALGLQQPLIQGNSLDDLYSAERGMLDLHTVIPLIHLPVASAAGGRVRHWQPGRAGDWSLSDVRLEADSR
ncbi:MAG TPA: ABC transporter substrate-binding protein [Terriglobales bacterium]|nr:ABC transporter substrate-binding protein [Terriglobales bacterium]